MKIFRFITLIILSLNLYAPVSHANLLWRQTRIPMKEAGPSGLEALLVWPDNPGKHPLALISHGSPRDAKERADMTAMSFLPVAMEFARRGYTAAVVLRRGYGTSGGGWAESYGTCQDTNYTHAAAESVKDLHAAIDYLTVLPLVDPDTIIAVGVSAGGFATVALTADSPPKGLRAAISFAGGRGSTANDTICQQDALITAFGQFGKTSRIPMLWVYAKNDHFFNPALAQRLFKTFNAAGGNASFVQAPAFSTDGHGLFSSAGIPVWTPIVDEFLKKQSLLLVNPLLPLPVPVAMKPPVELSVKNKTDFTKYISSPPHKAFAVAANGAYGWRSGGYSVAEAKRLALASCEKYATTHCKLYAVDDELTTT